MPIEPAANRQAEITVGSDRNFGLVFAAVFLVVALYPMLFGNALQLWALGLAGLFLALACMAPQVLHRLNVAWMHFGAFLHRIVSPLALVIIFLVAMVPMGMILRLQRKDLLRLRAKPEADSYWILRTPPGPDPHSLTQQF